MTDTASRTAGRTRGRDAAPQRPPRKPRTFRQRTRRFLDDHGDWILVGLSLIFLVAYAWPILDPSLNHTTQQVCRILQWSAWVGFAIDYFMRLWAARDRLRYFRRHLLDLAIVVLPVLLTPLRLVRLLVIFRIVNRKAGAAMRGQVPLYVTVSAAALIFLASLAVLSAERQAPPSMHANILSIGTALWWACVTVTTVGYGDHYPVTTEGRFIAVGLMIGGMALLGVVIASFASWFIGRVQVEEKEARAATQRDLEQVATRLDAVTKELAALRKLNEQQRDERVAPP